MRLRAAAALLALCAAPALAGPAQGPRTFKASITRASPLPAVPSGKVSGSELAPPPGISVSTRGPLLSVPDPVLTFPRRKAPAEAPLPPPNPFRTEGCPISFP
jgi:hypothetical protein